MSQMTTLSKQLRGIGAVAVLLIAIEFINMLTANSLNQFGIVPRSPGHLSGIITAPFLHGSVVHLLANLPVLLLFIWLSLQWGSKRFWLATLTIFVISGLGVWLFGRHAMHIGASGIVYGYFGFLVLAGFRSKKISLIVISVLVALLYGGMLVGLLPASQYVSFEYHLFGFISGLVAAWAWAK